ncbi:hypothetical protein LJC56_03595 [Christensenellaceae bacterium OttesenSCG-928-K19]|nr:hypothetical protein [Christensenellaceae bacterium OttesenSCG-928-K19]
MKKILVMVLATLMVAATAIGCSSTPSPETEIPAEETPEATDSPSSQPEEPADASSEDPSAQTQEIEGESIFGKVKSIVGNEIELELAKPPFDMGKPVEGIEGDAGSSTFSASTSQSIMIQGSEEDIANGDASVTNESGALADTSGMAIVAEDENGNVQYFGGGMGEGQELELEYTGETKSILVPAGAEILSLIGTEGTLDSIKKGSVLMLTVDDMTKERATADSVMIWE